MLYSTVFSPKFSPILPSVLIGEIFITLAVLSYVKDCIEDMATKVAGLREMFIQ